MVINKFNICDVRREYVSKQLLHRSKLTNNPMELFMKWLNEAYTVQKSDPTAMCLATVDKTGQPYQRLVLLKSFTNKTMIFYTNLNSRKSLHLSNNPKVSLCFPWNFINRQVTVTGKAYKLSTQKVYKYFHTRPKDNQISAWVSKQSTIISSKKILEKKFLQIKKRFGNKTIPLPSFWGGYKVKIKSIEFWQGDRNRLHDRFLYTSHQNGWYIDRLSP